MCGHEGLDPGEWVKVLTTIGEFTIPNFSIITIHQAMINYQVDGRNDPIMSEDDQKQPVLIYPRQIISVIT